MENMAAKVTAAYFDARGLHYQRMGDKGEVIRAGFELDNREAIKVNMFFDDNERSCKINTFELAKFPESRKPQMYKVCNELNARFRWIKFYVDEKDNTITAEDDAVIQIDSAAEEVFQCCLQLVHIADDAYPIIQKAIWAD